MKKTTFLKCLFFHFQLQLQPPNNGLSFRPQQVSNKQKNSDSAFFCRKKNISVLSFAYNGSWFLSVLQFTVVFIFFPILVPSSNGVSIEKEEKANVVIFIGSYVSLSYTFYKQQDNYARAYSESLIL